MKKLLFFIGIISISCNSSVKNNQEKATSGKIVGNSDWIALFDGTSVDKWRSAHSELFPDSGCQCGVRLRRKHGSHADLHPKTLR